MLIIFVIAVAALTVALTIRVTQLEKQLKFITKAATSMLQKNPNG